MTEKKPPEIFVHAGMHKTGTTEIQRAFYSAREALGAKGICYPSIGANHSAPIYSAFTERPTAYPWNVRAGRTDETATNAINQETLHDLGQAFEESDWSKVILSGEAISYLSEAAASRLISFLEQYSTDLKVIMYIRRPAAYINSAWQQRIRDGATIEHLIEKPELPNYRMRVEKFINLLTRDRVVLKLFSPETFKNGDLMSDFLDVIDEPKLDPLLSRQRTNTRWSGKATMILEAYNQLVPPFIEEHGLPKPNPMRTGMVARVVATLRGDGFRLPAGLSTDLLMRIGADIAWIEQQLGTNLSDKTASAAHCDLGKNTEFMELAHMLAELEVARRDNHNGLESLYVKALERFPDNPELTACLGRLKKHSETTP